MLDANAALLTQSQLAYHVRALNLDGHDAVNALSAEWEVVLLHALSLLGRVQHEVDLGGSSRPDLYFDTPDQQALMQTINESHPQAAHRIEQGSRWLEGEELADDISTYQERCLRCEWEETPFLQELKQLVDAGDLEQFDEENPFSFVADVATVTDEGLHQTNPIEAFTDELLRLLRKHGISKGINYRVGSFSEREAALEKRKLKLPDKGQLNARLFSTPKFKQFLHQIKTEPGRQHSVKFNEAKVEVEFSYHPQNRGITGSHATFRGVNRYAPDLRVPAFSFNQYDWKSNGVYRALRSKADQLKKSASSCRWGIFLCDGGSQLMHDRGVMQTRTAPEVIESFLRESSSVDFVVSASVDWGEKSRTPQGLFSSQLMGASLRDRVPLLMLWCGVNPRLVQTLEGRYFAARLVSLCLAIRLRLPDPVATPENALRWLRSTDKHVGRSIVDFSISGFVMDPKSVSFSSRALLELLAGHISLEEFLRRYGLAPTGNPELDALRQPLGNPFKAAFESGKSISFADLEVMEGDDDNTIKFRFDHDAAIAPFVAPNAELEKQPPS